MNDSFEEPEEIDMYPNGFGFGMKDLMNYEPLDDHIVSSEILNSIEKLDTLNKNTNENSKKSILMKRETKKIGLRLDDGIFAFNVDSSRSSFPQVDDEKDSNDESIKNSFPNAKIKEISKPVDLKSKKVDPHINNSPQRSSNPQSKGFQRLKTMSDKMFSIQINKLKENMTIAEEDEEEKTTKNFKAENNTIVRETNEDDTFEEARDIAESMPMNSPYKGGKKRGTLKTPLQEAVSHIKSKIRFEFEDLRMSAQTVSYFKKGNDLFFRTLTNLFEIQNFSINEEHIWVMKPSVQGKYLGLGCKSGSLKLILFFDLEKTVNELEEKFLLNGSDEYNTEGFKYNMNPIYKLLDEQVYRDYALHDSDIIDLCWSTYVK